jgi:hypothetical protein
MSLISKKDVDLLLCSGFAEEDLGLVDGGICGVQIYETPNDYFAKEIIQNAAEAGEVDLMDELYVEDDSIAKEGYDTSRKSLYESQEYAGNDDYLDGVPQNIREQVVWLRGVKLGKMAVWQRKGKNGYEWQIKNIKVEIPDEDKQRYRLMSREYQKELWISYAKDEWKKLWEYVADSLHCFPIEEKFSLTTKKGLEISLLAISADNVRKSGYTSLPAEARWITMVYFEKDKKK